MGRTSLGRSGLAFIKMAAATATLVCAPSIASADYLNGFTGNTSPGVLAGHGLEGTVNFAVLDTYRGPRGDHWGSRLADFNRRFVPGVDQWGKGSPGLDLTAKYIYLYQVVNDGDSPDSIDSAAIKLYVPLEYITSWGVMVDVGFADDDDESGERTPVSAANVFGFPHDFTDPGGYNTDVINPGMVLINTPDDPGINPTGLVLVPGALRATWTHGLVGHGKRTTIFGFTTNLPPMTGPVVIREDCGHVGQPACDPYDPVAPPRPVAPTH